MKRIAATLFSLAVFSVLSGPAYAVKFDPLFRVTSVTGECTVMPKGDTAFVPVQQDKAYHYGSVIKTGRKSSLIIVLADGNECQVLANAELEMQQDTTDPKLKIIKLKEGRVDVNLDPEFEESGYGLHVETAAAICGAIGCKFSNDVRSDNDMSVSTFGVSEGKVKIIGKNFNIPEMDVDDFISVATSLDREFTRIKNLKGSFVINCKNSAGEMQTHEIKLNSIVKLWARRADVGDNVTVTIIFTSPDGKVEQAFTYTERDERSVEEIAKARNEIRKDIKEALKKLDESDTIVTTTTTTTTTVTTTTTIPTNVPFVPDVTVTGRR